MAEGRRLAGRYEIGESIGSGGMAEVFAGRDTRLGRDVAIKMLRREFASDPTFIARFRREAQAAAQLNHPNIVSVYDTGDVGDVPFIVMEYVEGATLRQVMRNEGRLDIQRSLEIVADVCLAVQYSHEAGIIHRDLTAGNVMLTRTGVVKVMDFGIARAITTATITQTSAVIGTAQYLSPEQARGEHVDARSDIYSTGILLYELLTHSLPFSGDSAVAVAYQQVREDPESPSARNPDIAPEVEAVVLKALAKNPGNRYQTAEDFRDDILRASNGEQVLAQPVYGRESAGATTTLLTPSAASTTVMRAQGGKRGRRGVAYVVLTLATLLVFVAAALFVRSLVGDGGSGGRIPTPALKGMTEAEAITALTAKGLQAAPAKHEFVRPGQTDVAVGRVFKQDPIESIGLKKGSIVEFTISDGPKRFPMLELTGMSEEDALAAMRENLLTPIQHLRDADSPPGTVLETAPKAGTPVVWGDKVHYVVASGKVKVPNVIGLDQHAAVTELENAHFKVKITNLESDQPPNTVIDQTPKGGAAADRGSEVTIVVAQPGSTPTEEPTPSDTPSVEPT